MTITQPALLTSRSGSTRTSLQSKRKHYPICGYGSFRIDLLLKSNENILYDNQIARYEQVPEVRESTIPSCRKNIVECDCLRVDQWKRTVFKAHLCLQAKVEEFAHDRIVFNAKPNTEDIRGDDAGLGCDSHKKNYKIYKIKPALLINTVLQPQHRTTGKFLFTTQRSACTSGAILELGKCVDSLRQF